MKKSPSLFILAAVAIAILTCSQQASRAQATWLTAPANGSLTNPANWDGSFSNGSAWTFTNSSIGTLTNATTWTNGGITFTPNATNATGGALSLSGGALTLTGDILNQGTTQPTNSYAAVINSSITMSNTTTGYIVWATGSSWTGNGTVTYGSASNTGRLVLNPQGATNMSGFTGAFIATSGRINANSGSVSANADYTLNNSGGFFLGLSNTTFNFGSLSGNANIQVNTAGTTNTISIGAKGNNTTFSGNISTNQGGKINVIKTGTGTLTLSATNTYTGSTDVNQGTLLVNGLISNSSALTVASDGTVGGTGVINGATTINGALAPGNSIGTLTVSNTLTWNSSTNAWKFELGAAGVSMLSPGTSDLLAITGDFTKGTGSSFAFDFLGTGTQGWYKLVDWSGTTAFAGTDFSAANLGSGLSGSFTVDSGTSALYLEVVPEPTTVALLTLSGIGLAGHVIRRRRR